MKVYHKNCNFTKLVLLFINKYCNSSCWALLLFSDAFCDVSFEYEHHNLKYVYKNK